MRCRAGLRDTLRTAPPVRDLRLVNLVAPVVGRPETRGGAGSAVDVDDTAAGSTNQVVVVVADPILEASRRSSGLNAPDQSLGDEEAQCVVHRLQGNGTDLGPDDLGHGLSRDVRLPRDRAQDGQPLGGDLNTTFTKKTCRIGNHAIE
jgi:hypothetical protein